MKKIGFLLLCTALFGSSLALAGDKDKEGHWKGEVVDMACYLSHDAKGPDHAECAKRCVKNGQPMGLLTEDGKVFLLAADHKDGSAFEALKDLAGSDAEVTGMLSDSSGIKMITVTASKAAG